MRVLNTLALGLLCALPPTLTLAEMPAIAWQLKQAVKQIDSQADDFETAMATVEIVKRDVDGNIVRSQIGNSFIRANGDMRFSPDGGGRVVILDGNRLYDYVESDAQVTEYSAGRGSQRLEPYFRLGFSVSGRDMQKQYLVTILGEEEMEDTRTLVLELTPERDDDRQYVGKIRLWIDQASWMPRRQEFSMADRTVTTIDFTDVARNLELNPALFQRNWPRGTKRVRG